jgi:DNA-binding response OmpR family regulator
MNPFVSESSRVPRKKRQLLSPEISTAASKPLLPSPGRMPRPSPRSRKAAVEKPHIVLVEDCAEDVQLLEAALETAPFEVKLTRLANGREALFYFTSPIFNSDREDHPLPDILLLDLGLPGVSGLEVLKRVRALPGLDGLTVFALTSSHDDWDVYRANELLVDAYLTKPSTFAGLVELVRDIRRDWLRG